MDDVSFSTVCGSFGCGVRVEGEDHGGDESVLEQSRGAKDHALLGSSGELGFRTCGKLFLARKLLQMADGSALILFV